MFNSQNADTCFKKMEEFFRETDEILSNNQYLLGTEEPTYIDYSFAALAGESEYSYGIFVSFSQNQSFSSGPNSILN